MEKFNYKTSCTSSGLGVNVNARRHKFDLYIRIFELGNQYWGGKALVISRIEFNKTRQGHGSELLSFISDFAQEHQYDVIGIEQASTSSIHSFAEKHGFIRLENSSNYSVPVEQITTKTAQL
ncbi:hypothetical protein HSBAA_21430 [Vreelandella sulfidaeris]|uniref:N-acetyltransferase domain-containing protein n=1 Tax=Vreelandella sulfidaeris TaxID=115553 RepID=A0A455U5N2_9GAMM|nr:hypothetical protein HSBAA_21430 [Halomonas sulfidaeris]